ncbi:MAG: hypothetical protein O3A55_01645 [Bacteroidetes bacterium]|nr:hypothetical protein [Bacteroidota bacterium]
MNDSLLVDSISITKNQNPQNEYQLLNSLLIIICTGIVTYLLFSVRTK